MQIYPQLLVLGNVCKFFLPLLSKRLLLLLLLPLFSPVYIGRRRIERRSLPPPPSSLSPPSPVAPESLRRRELKNLFLSLTLAPSSPSPQTKGFFPRRSVRRRRKLAWRRWEEFFWMTCLGRRKEGRKEAKKIEGSVLSPARPYCHHRCGY